MPKHIAVNSCPLCAVVVSAYPFQMFQSRFISDCVDFQSLSSSCLFLLFFVDWFVDFVVCLLIGCCLWKDVCGI